MVLDCSLSLVCVLMVAMYLLGGSNDVIIEHIKATCSSCDCLVGHRAKTYL